MIFIRVEIWPHGNQDAKRTLGEAIIHNTGDGTSTRGTYAYILSRRGGFKERRHRGISMADVGNVLKRGIITDFPRKKLLAWDLLLRALQKARS